MKKIILLTLLSGFIYAQTGSVGIGTVSPDPSAILDIKATNKGMLLPVVSLTSATDLTTVANPKTGFIIYNKAISGVGTNVVDKGLYAFNGTIWEKMWTKDNVKTEIEKIPFITPVFAASNMATAGSFAAGSISNITFNTLYKDFPTGVQGPAGGYTGYMIQKAGGYVISYTVDIRNASGDTNTGTIIYVQKNGTTACSYGTEKNYQFGGVSSTCTLNLAAGDVISFRAQSSNASYNIVNPNVSISKISNN
ncbi:hypothetical protein SAMN05421664_2112 [Chryseobacterium soldanellicola]|uniref:C1q domain-containing protein n=1 Tax=Chryseobacterium soldanellicola TaxID=311333 RepID=A0A1H1CTU8_9FLAO|nr:hypothetical protein [Chryseobacterium soldanellicola]SDQ67459.1 hypothetical protein SAMN05421664_2112 [Chryseobacterium soldanellicola]